MSFASPRVKALIPKPAIKPATEITATRTNPRVTVNPEQKANSEVAGAVAEVVEAEAAVVDRVADRMVARVVALRTLVRPPMLAVGVSNPSGAIATTPATHRAATVATPAAISVTSPANPPHRHSLRRLVRNPSSSTARAAN